MKHSLGFMDRTKIFNRKEALFMFLYFDLVSFDVTVKRPTDR